MESFVFVNGKFRDKIDPQADNVSFIKRCFLNYDKMEAFEGILKMSMDGIVMHDHEKAKLMYAKAVSLGIINSDCEIIKKGYSYSLCKDKNTFGVEFDIDVTPTIFVEVKSVIRPEELKGDTVNLGESSGIGSDVKAVAFSSGVAAEAVAKNPDHDPSTILCFKTDDYVVDDVESRFKDSIGIPVTLACPGRVINDNSVTLDDFVSWHHFYEIVTITPLESSIDAKLFVNCKISECPSKMGKRFASGMHFYINNGAKGLRDIIIEFEKDAALGAVLFVRRLQRLFVVSKTTCDNYTILDDLVKDEVLLSGGYRNVCSGTYVAQSLYDNMLRSKNGFRSARACIVIMQFHSDYVTSCDFMFDGFGLVPIYPKSMEDVRCIRPVMTFETYETHLYFFLIIFFNDLLFKCIGKAGLTARKIRTMFGLRGAWFSVGRIAMFLGYLLSTKVLSIRGDTYVFSADNHEYWSAMINSSANAVERVLQKRFFSIGAKPFFGFGVETGVSPVDSSLGVAVRSEKKTRNESYYEYGGKNMIPMSNKGLETKGGSTFGINSQRWK